MSGSEWPAALLLVGCGNMGGAMLQGWLAGGMAPARVTVLDPMLAEAPDGVSLARRPEELSGRHFDAVLLGTKPQMLDAIAPMVAPFVTGSTTLLSILAGVELASLQRLFPQAGATVRIMPNLAAAIGKSPIALAGEAADPERRAAVAALMAPLGTPQWIDEPLFHAVTALAGSGPAFVYRYIDALAAAASELGLEQGQAQQLALAMVEGAALLAGASPDSPGDLARKVASPGGTTAAGLDVLDAEGALSGLVARTLQAAARRSAELAEASRSG